MTTPKPDADGAEIPAELQSLSKAALRRVLRELDYDLDAARAEGRRQALEEAAKLAETGNGRCGLPSHCDMVAGWLRELADQPTQEVPHAQD